MGTVVHPADRDDAARLARRLLAVAGESRHDEVRTVSGGPFGVAFEVPDDLAVEALGAAGADGADGWLSEPVVDGAREAAVLLDESGAVPIADSGGPPGKASRRSRR